MRYNTAAICLPNDGREDCRSRADGQPFTESSSLSLHAVMPGITVLCTSNQQSPSSIHYASPIEPFFPPSSSRQNSSEPATKHAFTAFLLSAFRAPLLFFTCNLHGVLQTRVLLRVPATSSPSGEGWVTNDIFSSFCRSGLILLGATSFDSPLSLFCGALSVSAHGCGVVGFSLSGAGRRLYGLYKWVRGLSGGMDGDVVGCEV